MRQGRDGSNGPSKAYDCIPHDVLLAKLEAYVFGLDSLNLMHRYPKNRLQRVKVNSTYNNWQKVKSNVLQGSVLGPLLFNPFSNGFIYVIESSKVCNLADDNIFYAFDDRIENVLRSLKGDINNVLGPDYMGVFIIGLEFQPAYPR